MNILSRHSLFCQRFLNTEVGIRWVPGINAGSRTFKWPICNSHSCIIPVEEQNSGLSETFLFFVEDWRSAPLVWGSNLQLIGDAKFTVWRELISTF